ncbi:glutathione synthase [Marinicella sp. S1101]|uniref:glutathione synthase n=1 Tax=Marinicella marina TaxID=2996016 RepID=UPI0022609ACD|nr:glutathione synthase [Marinicella marina]MCX7554607.1 glutathione synthase [Marinicella marina]MDJ1141009.1 glutathione synthase [Marinicella marina]
MTKLAVVMDPIEAINPKKDSSFAMLLAAQKRGYETFYMTANQLFLAADHAQARCRSVSVVDQSKDWYSLSEPGIKALNDFDIILMRKDPPFDMEYIMDTYILEQTDANTHVINKPQALRDANEKFFTEYFPECTPDNIISRNMELLKSYIQEMGDVIVKPMDGMGGNSIFKTSSKDKNLSVILETVTQNGTKTTIIQKYIPEISQGDKRILMINGQAVPYALARIPSDSDFRGNLAKGGTGKGVPLSKNDWRIAEIVGPKLKQMGIVFAGIDVIGDYLTEVNVTSPTCIRELDEIYDLDIASDLFDCIEQNIL